MNQRLLHYEILREIGRGGMGVVYQARDTRLDRPVAIKILPPEKVANAERKERFVREAKAASALNHPNIVTIHDINTDDGVDFIVMEYVGGKTLDELIPSKGLRASLALKYAVQIADALAEAHAVRIVHRDLKPSNVMVTDDDRVKVLDFGLAKLTDRSESSSEDSTLSVRPLTGEGTVIGTTPYMSPEQAEGRPLDGRSDIFSFGSLLYEMITGQKAFTGDSRFSTLAKILNEDPKPASQLVPSVAPDLAKVLSRCLRKDPARRYQFMADVKVALEDVQEESASGPEVLPARTAPRWLWISAAALAVVLSGGVVAWRHFRVVETLEAARLVPLTTFPGAEGHPTLSPQGTHVAFAWSGREQDNDDIYVQLIGSGGPLRLTQHPSRDFSPAWSPDGRWIAFLRGSVPGRSELRLIPPLGGPERMLAEVHVRQGYVGAPYLAWSADSRSLIAVDSRGERKPDGLILVSVESGEKRLLTNPEPPIVSETNPAVAPDGRSIVFRRNPSGELHWLPLGEDLTAAGPGRRLTDTRINGVQPAWMPDGREIVFAAHGNLWRVDLSGAAVPTRIPFVSDGAGMPVVSGTQAANPIRLVYVRGTADPNIWRVEAPAPGVPAPGSPAIAIASTRQDLNAQFSPDGRRVAFFSNRSGTAEIWTADPDGSDAVQLTAMDAPFTGTPRWSPDGRAIVFDSNLDGQYDVYVIPASGGKPRRLTVHPADDHVPSFSRDGKWIYFSSTRGGDVQIWKVPASGGDPVQVTRNGGFVGFESHDGAYVYYTQTSTESSALWRLPASGGDPVRIVEGVIQRAFAVLQNGIYYVEQSREHDAAPVRARLRFFDFATGASAIVATLGERITLGLTASPDGRTILYSRIDTPGSDLMLVENFR